MLVVVATCVGFANEVDGSKEQNSTEQSTAHRRQYHYITSLFNKKYYERYIHILTCAPPCFIYSSNIVGSCGANLHVGIKLLDDGLSC